MKKVFIIFSVLSLIIFIAGCDETTNKVSKNEKNGTLVCTKNTTDEDGFTTDETMTIEYKNNIVKNVNDSSVIQTDSEYIDFTISIGQALAEQFNSIDGMSYQFSKKDDSHINAVINVDYDKIDVDKLKELASEFDDEESNSNNFISSIKNKNLTLDEFKSQNLDGYSCKLE